VSTIGWPDCSIARGIGVRRTTVGRHVAPRPPPRASAVGAGGLHVRTARGRSVNGSGAAPAWKRGGAAVPAGANGSREADAALHLVSRAARSCRRLVIAGVEAAENHTAGTLFCRKGRWSRGTARASTVAIGLSLSVTLSASFSFSVAAGPG
jgi:hypothetical protein